MHSFRGDKFQNRSASLDAFRRRVERMRGSGGAIRLWAWPSTRATVTGPPGHWVMGRPQLLCDQQVLLVECDGHPSRVSREGDFARRRSDVALFRTLLNRIRVAHSSNVWSLMCFELQPGPYSYGMENSRNFMFYNVVMILLFSINVTNGQHDMHWVYYSVKNRIMSFELKTCAKIRSINTANAET